MEMTCEGCSGAVTRVLNKKGKYPGAHFRVVVILIVSCERAHIWAAHKQGSCENVSAREASLQGASSPHSLLWSVSFHACFPKVVLLVQGMQLWGKYLVYLLTGIFVIWHFYVDFLGEQNIEIDMEKQRVYVTSTLSADELLETIKKAGKTCSYVGVV